MSTTKFFGEGGPLHGGNLQWPGTGAGFPVRGAVPADLKQEEFEEIGHVLDFKAAAFRLWVPAEHADYLTIMDRAANGWFSIKFCERHWQPEHESYLIWLEWVQVYGELPNGKRPPDVSSPITHGSPRPATQSGTLRLPAF